MDGIDFRRQKLTSVDAILTNAKPTIYPNLYENTAPGLYFTVAIEFIQIDCLM